jgi:hypothetical protein
MKRHFERKFKCIKNIDAYKYEDEELYNLSMIKIKNDNYPEELLSTKKADSIDKNTEENIDIKHICEQCNLMFQNKSNLNRHLKKNACTNPSVTNITNNNNSNNTLNQQNNIININLKILKPFDDDWDVSNIDNTLKNILVLSSMKYTKTLEHILNNDTNLNVIIQDETNTGIVYKNSTEKFKPMTINDIIDKSMDKLHKQLQSFHSEIKEHNEFNISNDYLEEEKGVIEQKYNDFKTNKDVQSKVKEYITGLYNNKRNDTLKIYQELLLDNNLLEGY